MGVVTETVVVLVDDTDGTRLELKPRDPGESHPDARWSLEVPPSGAPLYVTDATLLRFVEVVRVAVERVRQDDER